MFGRIGRWWADLRLRYKNAVLEVSHDNREERLGLLLAEAQAIARMDRVQQQMPIAGLRADYLAQRGVVFLPIVGADGQIVWTPARPQEKPPERVLGIFPFTRDDAQMDMQGRMVKDAEIVVTYDRVGHNLVVNLDIGETPRAPRG
ncbi:hypothetical protein KW786_01240 [Candidatus Parcubacteria bacterium]|nr:hypothetical protein [Candidatus Parcubacteria bacterium]